MHESCSALSPPPQTKLPYLYYIIYKWVNVYGIFCSLTIIRIAFLLACLVFFINPIHSYSRWFVCSFVFPLRVVVIHFYGFFMCTRIMSSLTLYVHELYLATSFHIERSLTVNVSFFMGSRTFIFASNMLKNKLTDTTTATHTTLIIWMLVGGGWAGNEIKIKIKTESDRETECNRVNMIEWIWK